MTTSAVEFHFYGNKYTHRPPHDIQFPPRCLCPPLPLLSPFPSHRQTEKSVRQRMSSATDTLQELRLLLEDQVRRSGETNQVLGEGGGWRRVEEGSERRG